MKLISKKKISELSVEYFRLCSCGTLYLWQNLYSEVDDLYHELLTQYDEIQFKPNYYDELQQIYYSVCERAAESHKSVLKNAPK